MESEKKENIWRRKTLFRRKKRREIFGEGRYLVSRGEAEGKNILTEISGQWRRRKTNKEQKYLKNRNIWSEAEEKSAEGKDGKGKLLRDGDGRTVWCRHRRLHKWSSQPKKVNKNLPLNPPLKNEKV